MAFVGETVHITCSIKDAIWKKHGAPMPQSSSVSMYKLSLFNISLKHSGTYTCSQIKSAKEQLFSAILLVGGI